MICPIYESKHLKDASFYKWNFYNYIFRGLIIIVRSPLLKVYYKALYFLSGFF